MKFGQLIEHAEKNIFFKKLCRKWCREASYRPFLFLRCFILGKSKCSPTWFRYISIVLKLAYKRKKQCNTLRYKSRDMLNYDFLDKGLAIVFQQILWMIFQQKCSSCYNLFIDEISLPGCLYFLRYWAIYYYKCLTRLWRHGFWN